MYSSALVLALAVCVAYNSGVQASTTSIHPTATVTHVPTTTDMPSSSHMATPTHAPTAAPTQAMASASPTASHAPTAAPSQAMASASPTASMSKHVPTPTVAIAATAVAAILQKTCAKLNLTEKSEMLCCADLAGQTKLYNKMEKPYNEFKDLTCCGSSLEWYSPEKDICCNNKKHKKDDALGLQCATTVTPEQTYYTHGPEAKIQCGGKLHKLSALKVTSHAELECCNGQPIHRGTRMCCGTKDHPNEGMNGCCGNLPRPIGYLCYTDINNNEIKPYHPKNFQVCSGKLQSHAKPC